MTRIARFSEMTYIFDVLMENHQFELLFKKGSDKVMYNVYCMRYKLYIYIQDIN